MNVYDFDGTIYNGDSSIDFWLFCLRRYPTILKTCPKLLLQAGQYKLGRRSLEEFKSAFFGFLPTLTNIETDVISFWDSHLGRIAGWYLKQRQSDDVVVSASPAFLLSPVCEKLKIKPPIATEIDLTTGKIKGANCKGEEKVRRFLEQYPEAEICTFYSDSLSDSPFANIAQRSVIVRKNKLSPWPKTDAKQK